MVPEGHPIPASSVSDLQLIGLKETQIFSDHLLITYSIGFLHKMDYKAVCLHLLMCCVILVESGVNNCPRETCHCNRFRSVCTLVYCSDQFDTDTPLLVLKGKICANHFQTLYSLDNVRKELHSTSCRSLPLCE